MPPRDPYKARLKERREAMAFTERLHRRQMVSNALTSFFQSLPGNRPLQVATSLGLYQVARAAGGLLKGEQKWWERAAGSFEGLALTAGHVAYLTNAGGGAALQYDVPDVPVQGGDISSPFSGDPFRLPPVPDSSPRQTASAAPPHRRRSNR